MGTPTGRWSSLAVVIPSSGILNSHQNWWPMTSTTMCPSGLSGCVSNTVPMVGTAIATTMTAGRIGPGDLQFRVSMNLFRVRLHLACHGTE